MARKAKTIKEMYQHTKNQALARYGILIDQNAYQQMISKIKKQEAQFLYKQSLTRTIWKVKLNESCLVVVYDKSRGLICTALPIEAEQEQFNFHVRPAQEEYAFN